MKKIRCAKSIFRHTFFKEYSIKLLNIAVIASLCFGTNSVFADTKIVPSGPTYVGDIGYTIVDTEEASNTGFSFIQYEIDKQTGQIVNQATKYLTITKNNYPNGTVEYSWNNTNNRFNITVSGSPSKGTSSGSGYSGQYVGNSGNSTNRAGALTIQSNVGNITGDFIKNNAYVMYLSSHYYAQGGAIYVKNATVGDITGNFIGNIMSSPNGDSEGTIYADHGSFGNITGSFIGNIATAYRVVLGGVIRLYYSNAKDITADFIGNSSFASTNEAGAIISAGYSNINGNITGNFINNYVEGAFANGSCILQYANGNSNSSSVKDIIGNFIGNRIRTTSGDGYGGAIKNCVNNTTSVSSISNIKCIFINNGIDASGAAYGGVIANVLSGAKITSIDNSVFSNNYAITNSSSTFGGAIYNTGLISNIKNSSFYDNYVQSKSTSGSPKGGAIYTSTNLTFNSTDGYNSTYSGNYIQNGTNEAKLYEAIYVNSTTAELTFNATTNGQYTFNDYINGSSGYDVRFTGDSTGRVNLYNDVKNGDVIANTVTMNLANGEAHNYSFRTLNSNANAKWVVDVDLTNISTPVADKIVTSSSGSTGTVTLTGLNFISNNIDAIKNTPFQVKILQTQSNSLQLALSEAMSGGGVVVLQQGEKTAHSDEFSGSANWSSTYESYNLSTDVVGTIGLATTTTTNDSIGVTVTNVVENKSDVTTLGDTLKLVNQSELVTRSFNATEDGETYTVTDNLGKAGVGALTINGKPSAAENNGTINLNGHTGFELDKATTLNINDVNLKDTTNTDATLISVSSANANVNLTNVETTGNIIATTVFDMTTAGNTSLNGITTNVNLSNSGNLSNNGAITGSVTNTAGKFTNNAIITGTVNITGGEFENNAMITGNVTNAGTLTSSATNLGGSITNTNRLNLSGILTKSVLGNGTTYVDGTLTLNSGEIEGTLNANNGTITVSAGSATNHNIGTLTGSGNLELDVDYTGSSVAMDTFTATNAGTGTLTITDLNEIGTRKDFSIQVLSGSGDNLKLAIDNTIATSFHNEDVDTVYDYDPITNPAAWTDIFNTTKTKTTTTRDLFVENDNTLTYGVTDTDVEVSVTKTGDTLALVNQSTTDNREFNATSDGETYTAETNLGLAAAGTFTINGKPDGAENVGTIDLGGHKGFELDKATTLNLNDVKVTNASIVTGVVDATSTDAVVNLENAELDGNVNNAGTLNIGSNSKIGGTLTGTGTTNINSDFTVENSIIGNNIVLNNAELSFGTAGDISGANTFTANTGARLNLQDGVTKNTDLGHVTLNDNLTLKIDGNFASELIDTITVKSINANGKNIVIRDVNILTPTTKENFSISPIGATQEESVKADLASAIKYEAGDLAMTPIYKYHVNYNPDEAMLQFTRYGGGGSNDFNPAVLAEPVAAQAGAQATMNSTVNYAFQQADCFTKLPLVERMAIINANKYVVADDTSNSFSSTDFNTNMKIAADQYQSNAGVWVRPYTSFESIGLANGPTVDTITYGTLVGFDTDFKELKHGWDSVFTGYVGYNGAHLSYNSVSSTLNGGVLGATETFYKDNFWTALTATVGASVADTDTMYGHENSTSLLAGIASKTGYNFEFKGGKIILQPIWTMSYSMINTFNYKNAAGVNIESDPLHTIQLNPSIRLIGNLKNGWQPYASVGMVWNLLNETHVRANGTSLPNMHIRPYVQYGVGVQKSVGERFTGFGQAMIHNGGRNGIALTFGMRWALGKEKTSQLLHKKEVTKSEIKVNSTAKLQPVKVEQKKAQQIKHKQTGEKHVLKEAKTKPIHKISAIGED